MSLPEVGHVRSGWWPPGLAGQEKEFTRQKDHLNATPSPAHGGRREGVHLRGPEGAVTLADLFDGQRQLVVYHFMFDPSWDEGCRPAPRLRRALRGLLAHLGARTTAYAVVARAPYEKIAAYKEKRG